MNKEYKNIKKYLLENVWIEHKNENIIFIDGYLFTAKFHDDICKWEYDSDRFLEYQDEGFVKITGNDVKLAIDFIENQAYESGVM